jgi:hypothetical protein
MPRSKTGGRPVSRMDSGVVAIMLMKCNRACLIRRTKLPEVLIENDLRFETFPFKRIIANGRSVTSSALCHLVVWDMD